MSVIINGDTGITTPGVTDTGTLSVTGVTTLTGGLNTPLAVLQGGTGVTTSTGSGANVLGTSPTLTTPNFDSASLATISGTAPLYMCRAWVNFDGTASGTFAGGASTVTRIAASTTATITTATAHGLITGSTVYALTGVVAGTYTVTVLTSTTFTITTVATTALSAVSITFAVNSIRASGNVSSITDNGVGDYTVNFTTAMPDADYAVAIAKSGNTTTNNIVSSLSFYGGNLTPVSSASNHRFQTFSSAFALVDSTIVSIAIFR